ncbi:unnamed protein product [Cuscuta campestris]|uniref:Major facilitator superfamily (MFS) profile domain-containing protein n=1 Tax=Cuscuta campestris TaxID=132261 RepID=A0A484N8L0_9ASTE|nr:unnamed protein product [Cuscuta campestris]
MQAKPPHCSESNDECTPATTPQLVLLCAALFTFAAGYGGVMSSTLAFGADQLKHFENNASKTERYFTWFYATSSFSSFVGITGLVYLQENFGWKFGYGVLLALTLIAVVGFFSGSAWYMRPNPTKNLITGLFEVMVASYRNRHLKVYLGSDEIEYYSKGSTLSHPSDKLRCLNKACIIQDPERDLTADGRAVNPWKLCTVDQVEELKALIKVIPIWTTRVLMSINISQGSFSVLQATSLDRHISPKFEIPAGSVASFIAAFIVTWIVLYDRVILPLASAIRGKTVHFSTKSRMGCGIFVSFLAMAAVATVEGIRRGVAIKEGYEDDPKGVVHMSILWVVPQYALMGLAEGLNMIAQNEFYISEFPKSMSSIASSLFGLSMAIASLVSSCLMSIVNNLTSRGGRESWISSNINKGHYDYFHWVLAGLSMVNFLLFLAFSKAYGPFKDQRIEAQMDEEDEM